MTKTTYQGSTTRYVYNAANRLVMLRNPGYTQVDYQYDPAGRLLSRVTANGTRMTQQFDANGWQTRLTQYDATNALISDTTYTRNRVGNILTTVDGSGATTYAYDPLYRLKTADYPGTANDELFTWDKVGNRKTATKGSLVANANTRYYNYTTGTNRLLDVRIGSATGTIESAFTHDFEGRLTAQTGTGAKTLAWDAKSRVKTLTKSGSTETYSYDPMGPSTPMAARPTSPAALARVSARPLRHEGVLRISIAIRGG